ncbi:hypothetical protein [Paramicrobacterium fandaimingii]|uniref:hypothetical protein n=1 Tax=Paramicrobacterium fandaimingii TaxID=2708079 RepID=UPI00141EC616|nr:hypothetical protein [Microbacterium fandaimingii]
MTLKRTALWRLALSIVLILAGALVVTFTNLGIAGWILIVAGIVVEIIAVTRRPRE